MASAPSLSNALQPAIPSTSLEHCQQYSAQDGKELSMVFNFHHLKIDYKNGEKWSKVPFVLLNLNPYLIIGNRACMITAGPLCFGAITINHAWSVA
jgi:glycosidase